MKLDLALSKQKCIFILHSTFGLSGGGDGGAPVPSDLCGAGGGPEAALRPPRPRRRGQGDRPPDAAPHVARHPDLLIRLHPLLVLLLWCAACVLFTKMVRFTAHTLDACY